MCKLSRKFTSALLTLALLASVLPIGAVPAQAADTAGAFEVTGGNSGTDYSYSDGVGLPNICYTLRRKLFRVSLGDFQPSGLIGKLLYFLL